MKIFRISCDCCRKAFQVTPNCLQVDTLRASIPIVFIKENGKKEIRVEEIDMCQDCAKRFSELYYQIAKENRSSGLVGIEVGSNETL